MATTKPKTPPKAPAKAGVITPPAEVVSSGTQQTAENAAALAGVDPAAAHPATDPALANVVVAEVKAPKADKAKADVDTALDRLGKIESEAIRMGGDSGQAIRQLACEAMVALGFK